MRFNEFKKQAFESFSVSMPTSRRSPDVADLQKALVALGYPLPRFGVDGIRGPETEAAIKKFQSDNRLTASGKPDNATISKINDVLKSKPDLAKELKNSTPSDVKTSGPAQLPPLSQDAATQGKIGEVLNLIARYESRGNYNIILGGRIVPELTKMTLSQVYDFQRKMVRGGKESSAVGRYQYIRSSLEMVANQMGLDPNEAVFNPKTQDAIAIYDLRRRANLDSWLNGKLSDEQFLNNISKIWAGIPTSAGVSFYTGVGSNKAGTTAQNALAALQNIKSGTATA
jgi:muramidase (phage lysozyme)